jgi:hypothetical protein
MKVLLATTRRAVASAFVDLRVLEYSVWMCNRLDVAAGAPPSAIARKAEGVPLTAPGQGGRLAQGDEGNFRRAVETDGHLNRANPGVGV